MDEREQKVWRAPQDPRVRDTVSHMVDPIGDGLLYGWPYTRDKSVRELREDLGIEPREGAFSEHTQYGVVHYGPDYPWNPFDWRYGCSMVPVEHD